MVSHVDYPNAANWSRSPSSPEFVETLANVAATGEIAIRRAANSAAGRTLSSAVRKYPLWSVFVAGVLGFMLRGIGRSHAQGKAASVAGNKLLPGAKNAGKSRT